MKIQKGDLLEIRKGILVQQVNCRNVMGKGLAKSIYEKYPIVKDEYHKYCRSYNYPKDLLGKILPVKIDENLIIVNIFSQLNFGNDKNKRYTDYSAFRECIIGLLDYTNENNLNKNEIYLPYKIGCNLGGGKWDIISEILQDIEESSSIEFNILNKI